jgi:hypothetical protein
MYVLAPENTLIGLAKRKIPDARPSGYTVHVQAHMQNPDWSWPKEKFRITGYSIPILQDDVA